MVGRKSRKPYKGLGQKKRPGTDIVVFEGINDPDLPIFLARMESLKAAGYRMPAFLFISAHHELAKPPQA